MTYIDSQTKIASPKYKKDLLISISEAAKLLLPSSIPTIESNLSAVSEKIQRMNLHTNGRCFRSAKTTKKNEINPTKRLIYTNI